MIDFGMGVSCEILDPKDEFTPEVWEVRNKMEEVVTTLKYI